MGWQIYNNIQGKQIPDYAPQNDCSMIGYEKHTYIYNAMSYVISQRICL